MNAPVSNLYLTTKGICWFEKGEETDHVYGKDCSMITKDEIINRLSDGFPIYGSKTKYKIAALCLERIAKVHQIMDKLGV